jgi:membrane-bound lytic murein transglycosylase D
VVYRVKSGDVLGAIANRYGVSVQQLKEWNGITGSMIRVGQKLYIHADPSTL